ncbi:hypothetical protein CEXT_279951 [Caerostris extrusa]|uniref:Uncharacterized protein n=1 Tax=Caerostris extrusa TaxID=172846 RepID=A0AAV4PUK6_CAEEX|nr:hypothetical protein CEXT_279951 [Caerostris extrusa]
MNPAPAIERKPLKDNAPLKSGDVVFPLETELKRLVRLLCLMSVAFRPEVRGSCKQFHSHSVQNNYVITTLGDARVPRGQCGFIAQTCIPRGRKRKRFREDLKRRFPFSKEGLGKAQQLLIWLSDQRLRDSRH